jgi:hypothetical protein
VCPVCGKKDGAPDAVIVETGNPTDLDAAVTNIRALLVQSFKKYWELGRALLDCHNSGLYKARLDEKQRPVYRTWDAFAKAELELSGRQAREIMHVAERFTEAQVRKLGVERLKLLARAPEPHRERLLKRAPELSVREVKAEVQAVLGSPTSEKAKKSEVGDPSGEEVVCTFQNAASELPIVSNDGGQTKVATEVLPNVRVKYEVVLGERPVLRITRERASEAKS